VQNSAGWHLVRTETPELMNHLILGLAGSLLAGVSHRAVAQVQMSPPLWLEVPEPPGGGGARGIVAAIHRRLVYPPEARMACVTGRVFVAFDITPPGSVQQVKVVKPLWPPFDSAAVRAVRQLRFQPRPPRAGKVHYVVPIIYQVYEDTQAATKALRHQQQTQSATR
jgi:TonB family protein